MGVNSPTLERSTPCPVTPQSLAPHVLARRPCAARAGDPRRRLRGYAPRRGASSSRRPGPRYEGVEEGGLFAVRDGHQNQLTEDPADAEPSFSADGRHDRLRPRRHIYTVRPDGSGERRAHQRRRARLARRGSRRTAASSSSSGRQPRANPGHLYTVAINGGAASASSRPTPPTTAKPRFSRTARRSSSSAAPRVGGAARTTTSTRSGPTAPA